jgi:hypothetical protein
VSTTFTCSKISLKAREQFKESFRSVAVLPGGGFQQFNQSETERATQLAGRATPALV